MSSATVSSKFQILIPKEIRDALGLKAGQKLAFINTGSAVKLVPLPAVAELIGIARGSNTDNVRDRSERHLSSGTRRPRKAA